MKVSRGSVEHCCKSLSLGEGALSVGIVDVTVGVGGFLSWPLLARAGLSQSPVSWWLCPPPEKLVLRKRPHAAPT